MKEQEWSEWPFTGKKKTKEHDAKCVTKKLVAVKFEQMRHYERVFGTLFLDCQRLGTTLLFTEWSLLHGRGSLGES